MKMYLVKFFMAVAVLFSAVCVGAAEDSDLKSVQKSMSLRLKSVMEAKSKGTAGENNLGFLVLRGGDKVVDKIIKEENADRKIVYDSISAGQKGISSKEVGQMRAKEIAKKAKKDEWLQDAAGKWYQKDSESASKR